MRKLATSILDDPPDIATFLAHVMTGSGIGLNMPPADSRIVRMNPLIRPANKAGAWGAPGSMSAAQFTYLATLDMDAVEQPQVDAISKYADLWVRNIAPNEPIRMNGDTLSPEPRQVRFQDAITGSLVPGPPWQSFGLPVDFGSDLLTDATSNVGAAAF